MKFILSYNIAEIAVGVVKEIELIGKAEWKEVLGKFEEYFEKMGHTLNITFEKK